MAKTITNAIKLNKTPNAYLLTGIRGVGKTTTARLIAKALTVRRILIQKQNVLVRIFVKLVKKLLVQTI